MKHVALLCLVVLLVLVASAAQALTITGKVVDPAGKPIGGATVWLHFRGPGGPYRWQPVASTQAAADGSFSLTDPAREKIRPTDAERYAVTAHKAGLTVDGAQVSDTAERLKLTLAEASAVTGRVLGEGAKPIEGALVMVTRAYLRPDPSSITRYFPVPDDVSEALGVRTDAQGAFELRLLPEGWQPGLTVSASGYGRVALRREASERATFWLQPAGSLRGKLVFARKPERLAECVLRASAEVQEDGYVSEEVSPDEQGAFVFPELPPGSYRLSVEKQPLQDEHLVGLIRAAVTSGEEAMLEWGAQTTYPLHGRVIASDTKNGLPGVAVAFYFQGSDGSYSPKATTGPDGVYDTRCIQGTYMVTAWAPNFTRAKDRPSVTVEVGPGLSGNAPDVVLDRARDLTIRVVDTSGRPVAEAAVRRGVDFAPEYVSGKTDSKGQFVASDVGPGLIKFWADKGSLATATGRQVDGAKEQGPITLTLQPGVLCTLRAKVIDQDGKPIPAAEVYLHQTRGDARSSDRAGLTDAAGAFLKANARPGVTYALEFRAAHCSRYTTGQWTATPGAAHDFGAIRLQRRTGFVAGTVVDEAGTPLPGVTVLNAGGGPETVKVTTDDQGRFRLEGLESGSAWVLAQAANRPLAGVRVEVGVADVKLVLRPRSPSAMGAPPAPRPNPVPPEEAKRLARGMLVWQLNETKGSKNYGRELLIRWLAHIDSQAAFEAAAAHGDDAGPIRLELGKLHLADDPDESLALITQCGDAHYAARTLCEAAREYATTNPDLARRCVEEGLSIAGAIEDARWRLATQAQLASELAKSDPARGAQLLSQAQTEASALGVADSDAYVRGVVAGCLCERDLDAAIKLLEPIEDPSARDRHFSNLTRHVARTSLDRALELMGRLSGTWARDGALATALPFFPPDQLDRATELARGIQDPYQRSRGLTLLASVAPQDRQAALLEEAAAGLVGSGDGYRGTGGRAGEAAARVACVARRLGYPA
ncbi:MAG: carboxypeptidase regulatory-like domain-containing protein, partial [Gemmatimonadetes bacterium]|nr:carboxypeptidase regulatory-like domain-containing protein [Gemmatimonadota bacterium]